MKSYSMASEESAIIPPDQHERTTACDPGRSFIVQAPAGSGKTELLTQRYLKLLACVEAPEQIVALTFTRKAANEMRERILRALSAASKNTRPLPHQRQTFTFAKEALAKDALYQWQILLQPNRLCIYTIDSFSQKINQAIPVHEKGSMVNRISDQPSLLYQAAARNTIQFALEHDAYQEALTHLLNHLDNRQDKLVDLLIDLLANRDQWLQVVYDARQLDKITLEQALSWIEQHEIDRFKRSIPKHISHLLISVSRQVACVDNHLTSPRRSLRHWQSLDAIDREQITALCSLLLTSKNTLRKSFDHHVGLRRGLCSDLDYKTIKTDSIELLQTLEAHPEFLASLRRIKQLPSPRYDANQWDVLQALLTMLPVLNAQLHLIFQEENKTDFIAIAQQALCALGPEDEPTDLTLYLDHRIHHLLVDEFQDTSISQYTLLERLVQGWQPNDHKTLFIVGDPMQSIYRFRAAEVGLFIRAKRHGLSAVKLTPLRLTCNFRAVDALVHWVNQTFQSIFPDLEDIESGAITFHHSQETKRAVAEKEGIIKAVQCKNDLEEAESVVALIQHELSTHANDTIGLLVRTRSQLKRIMALLRQHNLPFQGIDIEPLSHLPHIRDVWSLTQALLMPANRLAWLSVLRSPWCGLILSDLHALANYAPKQSIYFALMYLSDIDLSKEGVIRCQYFYNVMTNAFHQRHQLPLVDWIINTLNDLHMEAILTLEEQEDLESFWELVEQFEEQGLINDLTSFEKALHGLYSKRATASRLQVMTIHKSKGLEFDCVIMPGLSQKPAKKDKPLLRWLKLPTEHHDLLLLSPIKSSHQDSCLLYSYLEMLDEQKNHYESQRLLYVGVTRAKKRLYLLDRCDKITEGSFRALLERISFNSDPIHSLNAEEPSQRRLEPNIETHYLPLEFYKRTIATSETHHQILFSSNSEHARLVGIITHKLLQWVCDNHPNTLEDIPWSWLSRTLTNTGLLGKAHDLAFTNIQRWIHTMFHDPIGQWLMQQHEDDDNELELLVLNEGRVTTRIIDRTFLHQGFRWVIDFKTGIDDQAISNHYHQVHEYALLLSKLHQEPIRCGIYYLATGTWKHWEHAIEPAISINE